MISAPPDTATIREATLDDLPALLAMCERFRQTEPYCHYIAHAPEVLEVFLRSLIDAFDRVLFVRTVPDHGVVGMLALVAYAHPMSGRRQASEMFWWLDPDHRGAGGWLLRRAEKWARAQGAETLSMISPWSNARVQETYRALGYQPLEVAYFKELGS